MIAYYSPEMLEFERIEAESASKRVSLWSAQVTVNNLIKLYPGLEKIKDELIVRYTKAYKESLQND